MEHHSLKYGLSLFALALVLAVSAAESITEIQPEDAIANPVILHPQCDFSVRYRTLDGSCNNELDPSRGAVGHLMYHPAALGPRANESLAVRPSARAVSNTLMSAPWSPPSERLTDFFTFFAQFVDHDIVRFAKPGAAAPQLPISLPPNEAAFRGTSLPFARLQRAPPNLLSSYLDASAVYGTTPAALAALRDPSDTCLLATAANGTELPPAHGAGRGAGFLAGDTRVNENTLLVALHTVWAREHNTLCVELARAFPAWGPYRRFKEARKIVGAALQAVTYEQFLPAIIGRSAMPEYRGYSATEDPRVSLLFAGAAFRVGHVLINPDVIARRADGTVERVGVEHTLFAPAAFRRLGLDALMRGAIATRAKAINLHVIDALRNALILAPGERRLDLAAINIQRGRDLRVPTYNDARRLHGLSPALSFADITADPILATKMHALYGTVNALDAWVGGLAEPPVEGSLMGALFTRVWVDEFRRMRDADRFYYRRPGIFDADTIERIPILRIILDTERHDVMRQVLLRNSALSKRDIPYNPFIALDS